MKHLLIFLFLFTALMSCSNEKAQSARVENGIVVDGLSGDWDNLPLTYNEDLKLAYGFANNDSALYFMIRFRDRNLIRMLSRRGITFWLNGKNKKDKTIGIHYVDMAMEPMQSPRGRNTMQRQTVYIPSGVFTLARNDSTDVGPEIDNIKGMAAAVRFEDGFYSFEFRIPFKQGNDTPYAVNFPQKGQIKACFEINPMSEQDKERMKEMMMSNRSSAGMSGEGGGHRGSGMGSGRGGGMGRQMPNTGGEEVWITVNLHRTK